MKHALNYGRISWSYGDFDPDSPCRPSPLITFNPIRLNGKLKYPNFSDRTSLLLLKLKTPGTLSFREAYEQWWKDGPSLDRELGEGRAFLRWLQRKQMSIKWSKKDFNLHSYFLQEDSPKHFAGDEMARGLSFAVKPVEVNKRKVILYLKDEDVLNLINMPYGLDEDFLLLVKNYVKMRFQWEEWQAPSPPFLDWMKAQARRPAFSRGQLGFCLAY
jgi:hypothetical protein